MIEPNIFIDYDGFGSDNHNEQNIKWKDTIKDATTQNSFAIQ